MCTLLLRLTPDARWPVLVAAVRDEFVERPWSPPAEHWPGLVGGRDDLGGGTWLAVDPVHSRMAALVNRWPKRNPPTDGTIRPTRGFLAVDALRGEPVFDPDLDSCYLVRASADGAEIWTWDGEALQHKILDPGDHVLVNPGLDVAGFPPLEEAASPDPDPGLPVEQAWADWIGLLAGGEFTGEYARPLLVRVEVDGRTYGTSSAALVALGPAAVRYDFTANPGPSAEWVPVPLLQDK